MDINDIVWPITIQNNSTKYLTIWFSHHWEDVDSPLSHYLSELLNDTSRAMEFLVTETHFTNFAILCAKVAFGVMPYVLPLIIAVLPIEYSDNPTQRPTKYRPCGNPRVYAVPTFIPPS
jgi:hypothetical protein